MLMNLKYRVFVCTIPSVCIQSFDASRESTKDMREKLSNKRVCANVCQFENNININLNINIKINNSNKLKSVSFAFCLQFSFSSTRRHF